MSENTNHQSITASISGFIDRFFMNAKGEYRNYKDAIKLSRLASQKEVNVGIRNAQLFLFEVFDFIGENPSQILSPIRPSLLQLVQFKAIHQAITENKLALSNFNKLVYQDNIPYLKLNYDLRFEYHDNNQVADFNTSIFVLWGINNNFTRTLSIFGMNPRNVISSIEIMSLPIVPRNSSNFISVASGIDPKIVNVNVYNSGARIVVDEHIKAYGRILNSTKQYYYLGGYSDSNNENSHLYGYNTENLNRISEQVEVKCNQTERVKVNINK